MSKSKSSISKVQSYKEIGEFWDSHDLAEYWEQTQPAKFKLDIKGRRRYTTAKGKIKTVKFAEEGIANLPKGKPIVYKILDQDGKNIYTGSAKRGRGPDRIKEHLSGGSDPILGGAKVQIEQMDSISDAKKKEANIILRSKPKYNKKA